MKQLISPRIAAQIQRRTKQHAYTDTCRIIYRDSSGVDALNNPQTADRESGTFKCSFTWFKKDEKWTEQKDIPMHDAEARVDKGVLVGSNDRFKIIQRYQTPQEQTFEFEIVDINERAEFGKVLHLMEMKP